MKKQGAVRVRPAKAGQFDERSLRNAVAAIEKQNVAAAIEKLIRNDPQRARQFLAMLKDAAESGSRSAVVRVAANFGVLGNAVAEAFQPTPLRTQPARLASSWATVGRLIGSNMVKVGERRDVHAG